jgi:aldehyde:ferredoxin oxidoreductase
MTINTEVSMNHRSNFEDWYQTTNLEPHAMWNAERQSYTPLSLKQICWETWMASRGINVRYKFKKTRDVLSERTLREAAEEAKHEQWEPPLND